MMKPRQVIVGLISIIYLCFELFSIQLACRCRRMVSVTEMSELLPEVPFGACSKRTAKLPAGFPAGRGSSTGGANTTMTVLPPTLTTWSKQDHPFLKSG